jgi:RNA polymerase sigma-70 factor (ECF subfamily)
MIDDVPFTRAQLPDELVQFYSGDVWRFASSQVNRREDAEDIVMETFAAAFADFDKVTRVSDQRLWLLAIARRKATDVLRRQYRRAERPLTDFENSSAKPWLDEDQLATRDALAQLPEPQREAVILKYVNGLSTEEVGIVIKRSLAATNSLLQRARQSLRETLGPQMTGSAGETTR